LCEKGGKYPSHCDSRESGVVNKQAHYSTITNVRRVGGREKGKKGKRN